MRAEDAAFRGTGFRTISRDISSGRPQSCSRISRSGNPCAYQSRIASNWSRRSSVKVLSEYPLVVGLISLFTGSTLQDDIAETSRRLVARGHDILGMVPRNVNQTPRWSQCQGCSAEAWPKSCGASRRADAVEPTGILGPLRIAEVGPSPIECVRTHA